MPFKMVDPRLIAAFIAAAFAVVAIVSAFLLSGGRYFAHSSGHDVYIVDRFTGDVVRHCSFDECEIIKGGRAK